jgi:hypothetical protein
MENRMKFRQNFKQTGSWISMLLVFLATVYHVTSFLSPYYYGSIILGLIATLSYDATVIALSLQKDHVIRNTGDAYEARKYTYIIYAVFAASVVANVSISYYNKFGQLLSVEDMAQRDPIQVVMVVVVSAAIPLLLLMVADLIGFRNIEKSFVNPKKLEFFNDVRYRISFVSIFSALMATFVHTFNFLNDNIFGSALFAGFATLAFDFAILILSLHRDDVENILSESEGAKMALKATQVVLLFCSVAMNIAEGFSSMYGAELTVANIESKLNILSALQLFVACALPPGLIFALSDGIGIYKFVGPENRKARDPKVEYQGRGTMRIPNLDE